MKKYDTVGIGAALLDFIIEVDDKTLIEMDLKKGQMHLVDEKKSEAILSKIKNLKIKTSPGGSAANTLAGISMLGGKSVLMGMVGNDPNGDIYIQESEKLGVFSKLSKKDLATGHAITFITPDSERTFATHLGAAIHFRQEDIFEEEIINSKILHVEGYQLEDPELKKASMHAMKIAKDNDVKVSIDLSDPSLVQRNKDNFIKIVKEYANIVFANEDEAKAFCGHENHEKALEYLNSMCDIAIVKIGKDGSLVMHNNMIYKIPAFETKVVNTNGAGDAYAAGFLYGLSNDHNIEKCGKIGSYLASLVVASDGARYQGKIDIDSALK